MTEKDYQLYGTKILNFSLPIYNIKLSTFDIFTERPFFTKSKISEKEGKTQEIGLLICLWKNQFADGEVDCLGFLPLSQSFAFSTACLSAQSARYPSFTRTEIRFATCVDKTGTRYNIEFDNVKVVEGDTL